MKVITIIIVVIERAKNQQSSKYNIIIVECQCMNQTQLQTVILLLYYLISQIGNRGYEKTIKQSIKT